MKYQARLSAHAERDVASVLAWFAEQDATVAGGRWLGRLMTAIATLERSPHRCALAAEAEDVGRDIRELVVGKRRGTYRVLFEIDGRKVFVLRIWHTSRDRLTRDDLSDEASA